MQSYRSRVPKREVEVSDQTHGQSKVGQQNIQFDFNPTTAIEELGAEIARHPYVTPLTAAIGVKDDPLE